MSLLQIQGLAKRYGPTTIFEDPSSGISALPLPSGFSSVRCTATTSDGTLSTPGSIS